jgi:hypothetical protein
LILERNFILNIWTRGYAFIAKPAVNY